MKHPVSNILCALSVMVLVWIAFFGPGMIWDGVIMRDVPVRVVWESDRSPVSGLQVLLLTTNTFEQIWRLPPAERTDVLGMAKNRHFLGVTDSTGRVTLRGQFPAGGHSSLLMRRGHFGITGQIGVITATDILVQVPLAKLLPEARRALTDSLPEIELTLDSTNTP